MQNRLLQYLILPAEITDFERGYLARMNRVALIFFLAHVPALMLVAAMAHTGVFKAGLLATLMVVGPVLAYSTLRNPRHVTKVFGITAMGMGGLLVHFGQGPMQIEMHFYFFVLLALLAVFADPLVIVLAAVTVALHHLILFLLLPRSVFNYDASLWAVVVHALFVVLESAAACFVARSFFDSVIGLERIVQGRTADLAKRTHDVRMMLDNTGQGFLTFDMQRRVAEEHSAVLVSWLGALPPERTIDSWLAIENPELAEMFALAWETVVDDVLPLELALAQMPKRMLVGERTFDLAYRPFLEGDRLAKMLLIISDVTSQVERERFEVDNQQISRVLEHVVRDRDGFHQFLTEADELIDPLTSSSTNRGEAQRLVHTLKGNCGLFGLHGVAALCHRLEDRIGERLEGFDAKDAEELVTQWRRLSTKIGVLLGEQGQGKFEVDEAEHARLIGAVQGGAGKEEILRTLEDWKLEPTQVRLARMADQARGIAARMEKDLEVRVESSGVRVTRAELASFWASLVHVVRNAVDHGIDTPEERARAGKPAAGALTLSTFIERDEFVFRIRDDGRGVDWDSVRDRASSKGMPSETRDDLVDALFTQGFSTREAATEYSGRGVGLSAVRATCQQLGGRVMLESSTGLSTQVELRLPRSRTRDRESLSCA